MTDSDISGAARAPRTLTAAEVTALSHLYRGEVYRSTVWRTRLDTTTNWSVVTLGVALSISFSSPEASPLPLVLVGVLILLFLSLEARRYRYFNVWRARARWMEKHWFAPMLHDGNLRLEEGWQVLLAEDYRRPQYHVTFLAALGRRIRSNYLWILLIQSLAYVGKLAVHPSAVGSWAEAMDRADVGPLPGEVLALGGVLYVGSWVALSLWSYRHDSHRFEQSGRVASDSMG